MERPQWMGERERSTRAAVLSRSWSDTGGEASFCVRQLAGALSRFASVTVTIPGPDGPGVADGAFDVMGVGGSGPHIGWPEPRDVNWPGEPPRVVLIDAGDERAHALAAERAPGAAVFEVSEVVQSTGVHVAINPLAASGRHNALGFTDYVLVLSDRSGSGADAPMPEHPTAMVAWLTAGFPRDDVVVVEGATAAVWRGRALRGVVGVDTRTDLWRLMAHARVVVDLAPGALVGRECVESLRFATPVIVPAGTRAADLAAEGGGLWFSDVAELLGCVAVYADSGVRNALGAQGRAAAEARYGDPRTFVDRVEAVTVP